MDAFRAPRVRRLRRQAGTVARAVRAARARPAPAPRSVDAETLRSLDASVAAEAVVVRVPLDRPPWTPSGLRIAPGRAVTWLAWGVGWLARPLGIGGSPGVLLGLRVGDGAPARGTGDTGTVTWSEGGEVELGSLFPGELRGDGSIETDRLPYRFMRGSLHAVVAVWPRGVSPRQALASIAPRDSSGLCAAEAARLAAPPGPPPGWESHPLLAPSGIYAAAGDGIGVRTSGDVGIVRRPADITLTETLRLRWSWRIDELPSRLPEDTTLTHDYLSVALEFDDGRDLTWHWSAALPEGFAYRCPLEHWRHRETHVVVRTGTRDLGRWVDEERAVLAAHRAAIGGPAPARVVRAWLIAVSLFQRGTGRGEIGRLELVDGERVVRVI